jgi:transcriptional regulator with XRE-family HTH domain
MIYTADMAPVYRSRRRLLGWSWADVARAAGITRPSYSKIEEGHTVTIHAVTHEKICKALGLDPDTLIAAEALMLALEGEQV